MRDKSKRRRGTPPERGSLLPRAEQSVCALLLFGGLVALTWYALAPLRREPVPEFRRNAPLPRGFVIEANEAEWIEWTLLPGIGPTLARRIVDYRRRFGPWDSLEDLRAIPGIGPRRIEAMRPYVRFSPRPESDQSAPKSSAGAE